MNCWRTECAVVRFIIVFLCIVLAEIVTASDGKLGDAFGEVAVLPFPENADRRNGFNAQTIYSSVRNGSLALSEPKMLDVASAPGETAVGFGGKSQVSMPARKRRELKREFLNFVFNDTHPEEEYFLGYSNNPFGSHTEYIKEKSGDTQYSFSNEFVGRGRRKRSVLHLYNMVLCATGCNPLSYKGYGCYCGFLGSGYVVDGIDSCCKIHDWCYDTAGCPMFLEYFIPYLWKCYNHHHPICAIDHGEFGGPGSCAQRLCECDRQLALCLKMYPCPTNKALCTSSPWRLLQNLFMN